jgi:hypothetical protein
MRIFLAEFLADFPVPDLTLKLQDLAACLAEIYLDCSLRPGLKVQG